ncbi:DNA repair protein RecN [Vulcanimicrobium alpinum]|uniref:DNA repair protein RecN n=1 Tax=Vulcanimicrobium alpinum TaxID=3016050 RepID=UPI00295ECD36|nr:DNA repair protein RecN [Vulcanimicrobium alpinum]
MGRSDQVAVTGAAPAVTLLRLTLENVGLIARAELEFGAGLTVVTGETGSGKTMLLGGLALALGGRAESDVVRAGAERARVSLEIAPDAALRARLAAAGFALADDDDVIVHREVLAGGRSQARINGVAAGASQVRDAIGTLVDIVSQHEAQRLLAPAYAIDLLDRYAGAPALALRDDVRERCDDVREARARLAALRDDDGRALARIEFARFALAEIDAAAIADDNEDERLRERRDVLADAERILASLAAASAALEDEGGAVDALGAAESGLAALARYGERFAELAAAAGALQSDANELAARIAREREAIELDPAELDALSARLDALDRLKKKYGGTLAEVGAQRETFAAAIADVDERDTRIAQAERAVREREAALAARAAELTALRADAAGALARAVRDELAALAMPAATLEVALEPLAEIGPHGGERAELRFAANPGELLRPLARVASGGELSRVLLALVVVLADRRERTALVFDEIDAGIGGATASAVGARLARLAENAQVVCVTHLAQIASFGDAHVALRKHARGEATTIEALPLDARGRTAEIARMLAGDERGVALEHAGALIDASRRTAQAARAR